MAKFEAGCISDVTSFLLKYWSNSARIIHLDAILQEIFCGGVNAALMMMMTACTKTDVAKLEDAWEQRATWLPPGHQQLKKSKVNPTLTNETSLPIKEDEPAVVPV